ncbi:MAG: hypothetical protein QXW39_09715 [Candidatus Bathyarchaeia archaeon]
MAVPDQLSKNLKIAKSCIGELVQDIKEGTLADDKNNVYQVLSFKWGPFLLTIIDKGRFVTVEIGVKILKEVRDKLSSLPDEVREQYRIAMLQEMLSNHRTGSTLIPQNLPDIRQFEGFYLQQHIHLTDGAISCNRLVDGIQEIVTVGVRVLNVLSLGLGMSATMNSPVKPAPDIYG